MSQEQHIREIKDDGYTLLPNVLTENECKLISNKLDEISQLEIKEFGEDYLKQNYEWGTLRALISRDNYFEKTIVNNLAYDLVSLILGDTSILYLQNGIIIFPDSDHRQARFHRDFDKKFTTNFPLSINCFWIIDDFDESTGGTWVVPKTHETPWPKEKFLSDNAIQIKAHKGSVLVFDSRLIHKGGKNISDKPRRAINHQYVLPFIKQQIDFPSLLNGKYNINSKIAQVLGFWSVPPKTVDQFRIKDPNQRSYRPGQG